MEGRTEGHGIKEPEGPQGGMGPGQSKTVSPWPRAGGPRVGHDGSGFGGMRQGLSPLPNVFPGIYPV